MFSFHGSPVPVRNDLRATYSNLWNHFAAPGPTLSGDQRVRLLESARSGESTQDEGGPVTSDVHDLARMLYRDPPSVTESVVRAAADSSTDATAVETIGLVSMMSAVDGGHRALGASLEPLPDPQPGEATGRIAEGMKRRSRHVPAPPGPIPFMLDLLPDEGEAFQASFGPQYMTGEEMEFADFARLPGLDRAQMELVSSRTSLVNECFY